MKRLARTVLGLSHAAVLMLALSQATAWAQVVAAIEYYHAALDHYFVTADADEIRALDNGTFKGWARTGASFGVYAAGSGEPGTMPVCRFYGNPAYGLDSHFYSASPDECAAVKQKWPQQWLLESDEVFRVAAPDPASGSCRHDTGPLYRLFNQRTDVNHRYTIIYAEAAYMVSRGYVMEGYGSPPVAMCVPPFEGPTAAPHCYIEVFDKEPIATDTDRLTAICDGRPTAYGWTNCSSTDYLCYPTSASPGPVTYTVVATNAVGDSAPVSVTLDWRASAPECAIAIFNSAPPIGAPQQLTASCKGHPTAYKWTNCVSTTDVCTVNSTTPGPQTYGLSGTNVWGTGATYELTLEWQDPTPACQLTSEFLNATVARLTAHCSNNPTKYVWTNCASTTATCMASSTVAGPITYTVAGVNADGTGAPASLIIEWAPSPPVCSISASSLAPITGGELTLTATCSGNPTYYIFYGCGAGSANTCTDVVTVPITKTYTVTATNLAGTSAPVSLDVTWQQGLVAPVCNFFTTSPEEFVGYVATLFADCTGHPTSYQWTGCASTGPMCDAMSAVPGDVTYTVTASNAAGSSKTYAVTVHWNPNEVGGAPPFCHLTASDYAPKVGSSITVTATCANEPTSYAWNGCASSGATCVATAAVPGPAVYFMQAANAYGLSLGLSVIVNWQP